MAAMRFVPAEQLRGEWERVRAGLVKVQEHSADDWLPEDIYMSLKTGNSSLHIAEDGNGDYLGFLILQLLPTFHSKKLHVWCAYSNDGKPLLRTFLRALREMATHAGATKITFSSPRDEWLSVGKRGGFLPTQCMFELSI